MQFNDNTNKTSLVHEINFLCDSDNTSYPNTDKVREVNAALEEVVGDIIDADGTWQYDDTNYTTMPRGKGTLVEGQQQYSFSSEYLQIEAIEILDTNNRYIRITPLDLNDLHGEGPDEHFGVDSSGNPLKGFPSNYDVQGDSIRLYPAPTSTEVTLANGIRVWFKRTAQLFAADGSDTTAEPGLPSPYHIILAFMASIPYCLKYHPERVAGYQIKAAELKKKLINHYSRREKDRPKVMRTRRIAFR